MKLFLRLILPSVLLLLLSGCWSYSELNERTIIAGAAIDLTESGEILLTAETVDFKDSESPGMESTILTGKGKSIAEAVYDIINQSGKRLYWYHATLLILDNKYAEHGIQELLDYILNEREMHLTLTMAVSRLETAAEVFELECHGSNIKSFAITSIIQEQSELGKTVESNAYYIINRMLEPGAEFALSQILSDVTEKSNSVDVSGCGVFKDDKLVGWLRDEETVFVQLLSDGVKRTEFDFLVDNSRVSVNVEDWNIHTDPVIVDEGVRSEMKISANYEILMIDGDINSNDPAAIERVNTALGDFVKDHLTDMVERLQGLSCDVLGWGNLIWQRNPDAYKTFTSWYDIFQDIETQIETDFKNNNSSTGMRILLN